MDESLDTRATLRRIEAVADALGWREANVILRTYRGPGSRSHARGHQEAAVVWRLSNSGLYRTVSRHAPTDAEAAAKLLAELVDIARARIEYDRAEAERATARADALAARLAAAMEARDG